MASRSRKPPWTDLPQELLSAIASSLTSNPLDAIAFRSVCKSWRSSFPRLPHPSLLSPSLPLPIPSPPFSFNAFHRNTNSISVTLIYAFRRPLELSYGIFSSSTPTSWILFLDEFNAGKLSLRKPFTNDKYSLPITFPETLNLLDFNASELGRFYNVTFCSLDLNKLVLFPDNSAAVALFDDGKLGFIRLDLGIREWEIIHDGKGFRFDDIIEFKGRVLGIDRRGRVYDIVHRISKLKSVVPPIPGGGGRRKRLVESFGSLYLVVRCKANPNKTREKSKANVEDHNEETNKTKFKVYELNESKKKWVEINSIGDRSFFFGTDFSFSASIQDLGTCGKDCILFKRESFKSYSREFDDYRPFCRLERSDLNFAVCHLNAGFLSMSVESSPGYSDILWPPPSWIWPLDRSKRLGILETAIDEILDKIPEKFKTAVKGETVEGAEVSCGDIRQQEFLSYLREVLKLKKMVISIKGSETKFMSAFGPRTDLLNQIQRKVLEARAASRDNEERDGWPNELKTDHDLLTYFVDTLREIEALVFHLEKMVTEVVKHGKHRLVPILA